MIIGTNSNTKYFSKDKVIWLVFIILFIVEFAWKPAFISGKVIGIYWLFVYLDKALFSIESLSISTPLIEIMLSLTLILFLAFVVMKSKNKGNYSFVGKISLGLFLCAVFLISDLLFSLKTFNSFPLRVQNRVYYLADYGGFMYQADALYACDSFGVFCKQARFWGWGTFMEGYVPDLSKVYGVLGFNKEANEIQIYLPDGGSDQYEVP